MKLFLSLHLVVMIGFFFFTAVSVALHTALQQRYLAQRLSQQAPFSNRNLTISREKYINESIFLNTDLGGEWVVTNSEKNLGTTIIIEGSYLGVHHELPNQYPINAAWKTDKKFPGNLHYWELKVLETNDAIFFGLTNETFFKNRTGWDVKGLLFGRNLSDGSRLLKPNFGPEAQDGDSIGLLVEVVDNRLRMYYDINGMPLGLAYDLEKNALINFFPMVHFLSNAKLEMEQPSTVEIQRERQQPEYYLYEGLWKTTPADCLDHGQRLNNFEKISELPIDEAHAFLTIAKLNGSLVRETYEFCLQVLNTIRFHVDKENVDKGKTLWTTLEPRTKTWLHGSSGYMAFETWIDRLITQPGSIYLEKTGDLIIIKGMTKCKWKRFKYVPESIKISPLTTDE